MKPSMALRIATRRIGVASTIAASLFLVAAAPAGPVSGPVATYWVSASTATGFMSGMTGGGRPSFGAIMGALGGGSSAPNRALTLQLSSTSLPTGAPTAEHLPPAGLGMGASLPLISPNPPKAAKTAPSETATRDPETFTRPKGKMLIYWGCGEHAPAGQPYVIDFSTIGAGMPIPPMPRMIEVRGERAPSLQTSTTYGIWPNDKSKTKVPATGSLVGSHAVRSDYSPPISFDLAPGRDFMPPLVLSTSGKTASGATQLTWTPVIGARGYFAMLFGAGGDGQTATAVMWSSSAGSPNLGGALLDYLPPAEVARLQAARVVLPAQATECVVPAEIIAAVKGGLVQMIAYGDEVNFDDPPRPQNPRTPWQLQTVVKVRFKSTATAILGMNMPAGQGAGQTQDESAGSRAKGMLRGLGGLGGLVH